MMKIKHIAIILLAAAVCVAAFYGQRKYAEHQTELMVQEQWEQLTPEQKAAAEAKVYQLVARVLWIWLIAVDRVLICPRPLNNHLHSQHFRH